MSSPVEVSMKRHVPPEFASSQCRHCTPPACLRSCTKMLATSLSMAQAVHLGAVIVVIAVLYRAVIWLHRRRQQKTFARRHGCAEPVLLEQESLLGIRMLWESAKGLRNNYYLTLTKERFHRYGNTFRFHQLLAPRILTIDQQNVKEVLMRLDDFGVGKQRAEAFEPLIGHGIFTADGEDAARLRKLVKPCFAQGRSDNLAMFEPHLQNLIARLPRNGRDPIDLAPLFSALTMDVSTEFLFHESTCVLSSETAASAGIRFSEAFDRGQKGVIKAFALGWLAKLLPGMGAQKEQRVVRDFMDQYVGRAMAARIGESGQQEKEEKSGYSFLEALSQQVDEPELIRGALLNLLLAGRDTTASLLSNLFFVLARRPEIYQTLAEEILAITPDPTQPPALQDIKSAKYLRACIDESLRLHAPIPRNSRTALRDTTLPRGGGPDGTEPIFVAEGTEVGYQVHSLHRRQDIFGEDAEHFVPERWTQRDMRTEWAFLPFNNGKRICIGQQLARNLASYTVFRLVQRFESVQSCDDSEWEEELGITCSTKNGAWVNLRQREAE